MNLNELLNKNIEISEELIDEAKHIRPTDYERRWIEFTPEERKAYEEKTGKKLYGYYSYKHREEAGASFNDGFVVHHVDNDKHDNKKANLKKISRSEHCKVDPNAAKPHKGEVCKDCGDKYYARGYCFKCYMKHLRKGDFGKYNPKNNLSKKDR